MTSGALLLAGHYCATLATVVPSACPPGTHLPNGGGSNRSHCYSCYPGQYQPESGQDVCLSCLPGKFSPGYRGTTCDSCPKGGFCPDPGAGSLALAYVPCSSGTFNSKRGQDSADDCTDCPPGTFNSLVGQESDASCRPCPAGTFGSMTGNEMCTPCAGGSFQAATGATGCSSCEPGYVCPIGSTSPVPCDAGTWASATDLTAKEQCHDVEAGFWAPTGSSIPDQCPSSGFYCPGKAFDTANEQPGSKPVLLPTGGIVETVTVEVVETQMVEWVETTFTVEQDSSSYDVAQALLSPSLFRMRGHPPSFFPTPPHHQDPSPHLAPSRQAPAPHHHHTHYHTHTTTTTAAAAAARAPLPPIGVAPLFLLWQLRIDIAEAYGLPLGAIQVEASSELKRGIRRSARLLLHASLD